MNAIATFVPKQRVPQIPSSKVNAAARDFEAMMVTFLLRPLEQTMASIPGKDEDAGGQDYASMATEELAKALATGRGFGIARILLRNLHQSADPGVTADQDDTPKVPALSRR